MFKKKRICRNTMFYRFSGSNSGQQCVNLSQMAIKRRQQWAALCLLLYFITDFFISSVILSNSPWYRKHEICIIHFLHHSTHLAIHFAFFNKRKENFGENFLYKTERKKHVFEFFSTKTDRFVLRESFLFSY